MTSADVLRRVPGGFVSGPLLLATAKIRCAIWNRRAHAPRASQIDCLLSHCHAARDTEFGRRHKLDRVTSYAQFRDRVPLRTYAEFEPDLERMRKGERDVLWPGLIRMWGRSSGTSNTKARHKYLPISEQQIRFQQRGGFDVVCRYLARTNDLDFTSGYTLNLLPPAILKREGPVFVTSNPGVMQLRMPRLGRLNVLPRPEVRDIEDYDDKLTAIAETYLSHDVRALSGTTCWFSVLFDRVLEVARARGRKADSIADVWPNLAGLFGGGVHAAPYLPILRERMGRPFVLIDNYNATEGGILAVSDSAADDGMLVVPDRGVFFEFVPVADVGTPRPRRFAVWEIEAGVDYTVAVTTASGLSAYLLGDCVRFRSVTPPRLEFSGRIGGMLSITQELTSQAEIERAVATAAAKHPCHIVDYAACAEHGVDGTGKGRYQLFFEFDREPRDLDLFAASIDDALRIENRVYGEHRADDVAILKPHVLPLVRGATRRFMVATGRAGVQQKFPRIADDRGRAVLRDLADEYTKRGTP